MLKRENVVVDFDSATGVEVEGSVGASKVDESAGGGPKHRLKIERLDPSKGFSVAGSVAPTNHFVARQATIASPSTLTFFPPMSTNMSLVVRFQDPPKRPHLCSLLPGGVEAEPILTGQDCGNISEPRLGRGMRFDDLGRMRVTPQMLQDEKMKSRSVVSGGFGVAPGGGGTHNFRISNSWGSMEPTRKRRRQYPNGGEAATGRYAPRPSHYQHRGGPPRGGHYRPPPPNYYRQPRGGAYPRGFPPGRQYPRGYRPPRATTYRAAPEYPRGYPPARPSYSAGAPPRGRTNAVPTFESMKEQLRRTLGRRRQ